MHFPKPVTPLAPARVYFTLLSSGNLTKFFFLISFLLFTHLTSIAQCDNDIYDLADESLVDDVPDEAELEAGTLYCTEANLLAWFKTIEAMNADGDIVSSWYDFSNCGRQLKIFQEECDDRTDFFGKIYSINYNRALRIGEFGIDTEFRIGNSLSNEITVMAVLVPQKRRIEDRETEDVRLDLPDIGTVRSLDIDVLHVLSPLSNKEDIDYDHYEDIESNCIGIDGSGADMLIQAPAVSPYTPDENYDFERYGKIITYQTVIRQDRCYSINGMMGQLYRLNFDATFPFIQQDGLIPEFLVFDGILSEHDRAKAETYLAIKYGISKEMDYVWCGEEEDEAVWDYCPEMNEEFPAYQRYNYRKTGIARDDQWSLQQSRSNSYYDERIKREDDFTLGRYIQYDDPMQSDYSHSKERLLTIGIEDESSGIRCRAEDRSYHIWGDNDAGLDLLDETGIGWNNQEVEHLERIWKMEKTGAQGYVPSIRWLNYVGLDNFGLRRDHEFGYCASTTHIVEDPITETTEGTFSFMINSLGGDGTLIGFASNNMDFVLGSSGSSEAGLLYGIEIKGGTAQIVRDIGGTGTHQYLDPPQILSLSEDVEYTFYHRREPDQTYYFELRGAGDEVYPFRSDYVCVGTGEVYAKIYINGGGSFYNLEGENFLGSFQQATNVEFSISQVSELAGMSDSDMKSKVPLLLISNQDREFRDPIDAIAGSYSITPGGQHDKIEFTRVLWDDTRSQLFTLGFADCPEPKLDAVDTKVCCDRLMIGFTAIENCKPDHPIRYELRDDSDALVTSGLYEPGNHNPDDCIEAAYQIPGTFDLGVSYTLHVHFSDCYELTASINEDELPFPEELIEDPSICIGERVTLVESDILTKCSNGVNYNWYRVSDDVMEDLGSTGGPDINDDLEEGVYLLVVEKECIDGYFCEATEEVIIENCCAVDVIVEEEFCCPCAYVNVSIQTNDVQCEEIISGPALMTITNLNNTCDYSFEIPLNGDPVPLDICFEPGSYDYYLTYANGEIEEGLDFEIKGYDQYKNNIDLGLQKLDFDLSTHSEFGQYGNFIGLVSELVSNGDVPTEKECGLAQFDAANAEARDADELIFSDVGCYLVEIIELCDNEDLLFSCPSGLETNEFDFFQNNYDLFDNTCRDRYCFCISECDQPIIGYDADVKHPTCDNPVGSVIITPEGGELPYSYILEEGGLELILDADGRIENLLPGTYNTTVTDACDYAVVDSFTVEFPAPPDVTTIIPDLLCASDLPGILTVEASGVEPLSYEWSTGETTPSIEYDSSGIYSVIVTDAQGCQTTDEVTIDALTDVVASATSNSPVCTGDEIMLMSSPDNMASYVWEGPLGFSSTLQNPSRIAEQNNYAGIYTVTVTDHSGCSSTASTLVQINPHIQSFVDYITNDICGSGVGEIDIFSVSGGTEPFSYNWSGPEGFTSDQNHITGLYEGDYLITITDINGCSYDKKIIVSNNQRCSEFSSIEISGDNVNSCLDNYAEVFVSAACMQPITYEVTSTGFSYYDSGEYNGGRIHLNLDQLPAQSEGTVTVTLTDGNGCSWSDTRDYSKCPYTDNCSIVNTYIDGTYCEFNNALNKMQVRVDFNAELEIGCLNQECEPDCASTRCNLRSTNEVMIVNGHDISHELSRWPILYPKQCDDSSIKIFQSFFEWDCRFAGMSGVFSIDIINYVEGEIVGSYSGSFIYPSGCSDPVDVEITGETILCNGEESTTLFADVLDGSPVYSYDWSTGEESGYIDVTESGLYNVTVTDQYNCTDEAQAEVVFATGFSAECEIQQLRPTLNHPKGICEAQWQDKGTTNNDVRLYARTDKSGLQYHWTTDWTSNITRFDLNYLNLKDLTPGIWTASVTITDPSTGCIEVLDYTIIVEGTCLPECIEVQDDCNGASNGSITIEENAVAPFTYEWSDGQTTNPATGLSAGIYSVTITDALGCTGEVTCEVEGSDYSKTCQIREHYLPDKLHDGLCELVWTDKGTTLNDATLYAQSGTSGQTFVWTTDWTGPTSGGTSTSNWIRLNNMTVGKWNASVTVTDNNTGCTETLDYCITILPPCADSEVSASNNSPICEGDDILFLSGPDDMVSYAWEGPQGFTSTLQNPIITNAERNQYGLYTLTVTDDEGCTGTASTRVRVIANLLSTPDFVTPDYCDASIGAIDINAYNGLPPYSYSWSGPDGYTATTQDISSLRSGIYTVLIEDALGCSKSETVEVPNFNDCSLNSRISFHQGDYAYSHPGCKDITVGFIADSKCASPITFEISSSGDLTFETISPQVWTRGDNFIIPATQEAIGASGEYTVTVTDANGCIFSDSFAFTRCSYEDGIQLTNSGTLIEVGCSESDYRFIEMTFSFDLEIGCNPEYNAGVLGYHLRGTNENVEVGGENLWASFSFGNNATGLCNTTTYYEKLKVLWDCSLAGQEGIYSFDLYSETINEVVGTASGIFTYPTGCSPDTEVLISSGDISCDGSIPTTLTANVENGSSNYDFLWSTGEVTKSINVMSSGTYSVTVSDYYNCTDEDDIVLDMSSGIITPECVAVRDESNAQANGMILVGSDGTAPYAYEWSNGQTTNPAVGLVAGTYTVTVTDDTGCSGVMSCQVKSCQNSSNFSADVPPDPGGDPCPCTEAISASYTVDSGHCGLNDASVTLDIVGGAPPYYYELGTISGVFQNGQGNVIENLAPGSYNLYIADFGHCTFETIVVIQPPTTLGDITIEITNETCQENEFYVDVVDVTGGTPPYTYLWENGETTSFIKDVSGYHRLTVTDELGCTAVKAVQAYLPNIMRIDKEDPLCGINNGSLSPVVWFGVPGYSYLWNTGETTETIQNLGPGNYTLTVTDAMGCTDVENIALNYVDEIEISTSGGNQGFLEGRYLPAGMNINWWFNPQYVTDQLIIRDANGTVIINTAGVTNGSQVDCNSALCCNCCSDHFLADLNGQIINLAPGIGTAYVNTPGLEGSFTTTTSGNYQIEVIGSLCTGSTNWELSLSCSTTIAKNDARYSEEFVGAISDTFSHNRLMQTISPEIENISFDLMPNPAKDHVTLRKYGAYSDPYNLKILDLSGRAVITANDIDSDNYVIDLTNLSPGLYLVHVTIEDMVVIKKLVVERKYDD